MEIDYDCPFVNLCLPKTYAWQYIPKILHCHWMRRIHFLLSLWLAYFKNTNNNVWAQILKVYFEMKATFLRGCPPLAQRYMMKSKLDNCNGLRFYAMAQFFMSFLVLKPINNSFIITHTIDPWFQLPSPIQSLNIQSIHRNFNFWPYFWAFFLFLPINLSILLTRLLREFGLFDPKIFTDPTLDRGVELVVLHKRKELVALFLVGAH